MPASLLAFPQACFSIDFDFFTLSFLEGTVADFSAGYVIENKISPSTCSIPSAGLLHLTGLDGVARAY